MNKFLKPLLTLLACIASAQSIAADQVAYQDIVDAAKNFDQALCSSLSTAISSAIKTPATYFVLGSLPLAYNAWKCGSYRFMRPFTCLARYIPAATVALGGLLSIPLTQEGCNPVKTTAYGLAFTGGLAVLSTMCGYNPFEIGAFISKY